MKNTIVLGILGVALNSILAGCSHKAANPDLDAVSAPKNEELAMPVCGPGGCPISINDYLKDVALPKIVNSPVVHECFLSSSRVKKKELKPGFLSYQFEIKLAPEGNHVIVENVYLSSFQNLPEWTRPCIIEKYKKFTFPPFPDAKLKSANAYGKVSISWNP